jgi:hypothetical protein
VQVVLADGTFLDTMLWLPKDNSGFDLKQVSAW